MGKKKKIGWKLWQKIILGIAIVTLITGLGFLLFPTVSNFFGQQRANSTIDDFNRSMQQIIPEDDISTDSNAAGITSKNYKDALKKGEIDKEGYKIDKNGNRISDSPYVFEYDLNALYRDSIKYNEGLINHQGTVDTSDYTSAALNMSSYGLSNFYCYINAPSIRMYLPVYLGANDAMMSSGAAHLTGTSLPVDQNNTNVAVAGHTGYIGRIFFDNIKYLDIGDSVYVFNYWETIKYEVIDYKVVPEDDTSDLYIQENRQLLTLITCTYSDDGTRFDRYIVICEKK